MTNKRYITTLNRQRSYGKNTQSVHKQKNTQKTHKTMTNITQNDQNLLKEQKK